MTHHCHLNSVQGSLLCCAVQQHQMDLSAQQNHCTFDLFSGNKKSLSRTSGATGNAWPYRISFSRNTTGSGSRIAAFSNPRASSASYGATTCETTNADVCRRQSNLRLDVSSFLFHRGDLDYNATILPHHTIAILRIQPYNFLSFRLASHRCSDSNLQHCNIQ